MTVGLDLNASESRDAYRTVVLMRNRTVVLTSWDRRMSDCVPFLTWFVPTLSFPCGLRAADAQARIVNGYSTVR